MASLYATTVCLLRLHRQVTLMTNSMKWSQRKPHPATICQHVTSHRRTHHTVEVFSSDEQSQTGRNWVLDIPRCPSNCGRSLHSGPLSLIYRTLLLTHAAELFLRATHLRERPRLTPSFMSAFGLRSFRTSPTLCETIMTLRRQLDSYDAKKLTQTREANISRKASPRASFVTLLSCGAKQH